ncbi:MAG: bifunctional folylpolyglutamate synthase/dihydrofolate synthase [Flavobacteriales bacterium]|jgi:dihydrofolate synthase/folylpolyglutamate synthase|nr:bifunctional folylpolyglutamate synthase/dihydrofolate synthase [Flavobacteriales bacterium]
MPSSYQETLDFLYTQLPQYQNVGGKAYKPSLDNISQLCERINNPQKKLKAVHLAGTNGKGSTSSLLASILTESGYKVGLFTSPHLIDFRERIAIDGKAIPESDVIDFVEQYRSVVKDIEPSFFEWTTALAFYYFANKEVDIAIIETGLGGRLDSSNIIQPLVSVITTIGMDHTQYLGNTLRAIAFEKGGIIKDKTPCVVGYGIKGEALDEIQRIAQEKKAPLVIPELPKVIYNSGLLGEVQQYNIATVIEVIKLLQPIFQELTSKTVVQGLENVTKNTLLRGRWEVLSIKPKIVADIAHNVQAVKAITNQLEKEKYSNLHIVWGMVEDKDIEKVVELLPNDAIYYLCEPNIRRAKELYDLATFFKGKNVVLCGSCEGAYQQARKMAQVDDLLLVSGSNFVVSEVIAFLEQ